MKQRKVVYKEMLIILKAPRPSTFPLVRLLWHNDVRIKSLSVRQTHDKSNTCSFKEQHHVMFLKVSSANSRGSGQRVLYLFTPGLLVLYIYRISPKNVNKFGKE